MEAINKAFLQTQNQQNAFAAVRGITTNMLTAHNPNRNKLFYRARLITEDDDDEAGGYRPGDVIILPSGPLVNGHLEVSSADMMDGKPDVPYTIAQLIDPDDPTAPIQQVRQGQYALKVVMSTTDDTNIFGPPGSLIIVDAADISSAVCMNIAAANVLIDSQRLQGDTQLSMHHPPSSKNRSEFQAYERMASLFDPTKRDEAFFPNITKPTQMTASTISIIAAVDWLQVKVNLFFNKSLRPTLVLSQETIKHLLLGGQIKLADFTLTNDKQSSYPVAAVLAQVHVMAQVMRLIFLPAFVDSFMHMALILVHHINTPSADGESVALAIAKQWALCSTLPLTRPDVTPSQAMREAWDIDSQSDTVREINLAITAARSLDLQRQVTTLQAAVSSQSHGNGGASAKRSSGASRTNPAADRHSSDLTGTKRLMGRSPFNAWLAQKPAAAKAMKPPLCAFTGMCKKDDCGYGHDIEKVPSDARLVVDAWLAKRPETTGVRPKKSKV